MSEKSEKSTEGSNVLLFKTASQQTASKNKVATVVSELRELLDIYDRLIGLLRETDNEGLDILTDSLVLLVVRCRETLDNGIDEKTGLDLLKEMRKELRETPQTLRSILPGIGPRLGESLQYKLGILFTAY